MNLDDFNPGAAVRTEDCDEGTALTVEFACGRLRGWLDVEDGVCGRKVSVWLYAKPTNQKIASWKAAE